MDSKKTTLMAVLVAALGYFVDVFDILLFSVVRISSLKSLGVPDSQMLSTSVMLINSQMAGLLLGGFIWGILGDKRGRISVLFGSIILYSVGNILNGFVTNTTQYALIRFFTGIGLAGELGAGITLVSELISAKNRGYATTFVAFVGVFGAVVAALVGEIFDWRISYFIGGGLGLSLLVLRIAVAESHLFDKVKLSPASKGDIRMLFNNKDRFTRFLSCIAVGVPIWFSIGIIITFSPEIGRTLGMAEPPSAGIAIIYAYLGVSIGDLLSGLLSQILKSRRKAIAIFLIISAITIGVVLSKFGMTTQEFYIWSLLLGVGSGYWAVFITSSAEQFGTNLRATVTTAVPNLVRGSVIPATMLFDFLRTHIGTINSALAVGAISMTIAVAALISLKESYGQNLDFIEE
jgi:MFS family permease